MTNNTLSYDVLGIGNAIVDVLSHAEDDFLHDHGMTKGAMQLIDEVQAEKLYDAMGVSTECSGGSAANTIAGLAELGARTAFIGKVRDDQLGAIFRHDMRAIGVQFDTQPSTDGKATARCLICVTPDSERTMSTYIGACDEITADDIDAEKIASSQIMYVEGYLWDQPHAKAALRHALKIANEKDTKVAFSLSDLFCVERHKEEFRQLLEEHVDILFANDGEAMALCGTSEVEEALAYLGGRCQIAAVTQGAKGSLVVGRGERHTIPATEAPELMDTTGAGDLYACGFLYGLTQQWSLEACGRFGGECAAHIIQQMGARALTPLPTPQPKAA